MSKQENELVSTGGSGAISFYENLDDPLDAVNKLGMSISESGMFGCKSVYQGQILAMACMCERRNPLEVVRTYHMIGGKLSMRADAMLAEFNKQGGVHDILQRTPDIAEVKLTLGNQSQTFSLSFEEAQQEPFVWGKNDKQGNRQLKDNWATPRSRMQMLWARVVSDGVRTMRPGIVAGYYTPEEVGDFSEAVRPALSPEGEKRRKELETKQTDQVVQDVKERLSANQCEVIDVECEPVQSVAPTPPQMNTDDRPEAEKQIVTEEQLQEMMQLLQALGMSPEEWRARLNNEYNAESARELSQEQGDRLIVQLKELHQALKNKTGLDQWATNALSS